MVRVWDCVGEEQITKGEFHIINGRINDIAWDSESKRIISVGDGKERFGHCMTWEYVYLTNRNTIDRDANYMQIAPETQSVR